MNVLVIGASGGTGLAVIARAVADGHRVTALARRPEAVGGRPGVTTVRGDVLDPASLAAAVPGHDAVVSALGSKLSRRPTTLLSDGTRNVLAAMAAGGVRRLVCITGIGAGDSRGHGGFLYDRLILPLLLREVYADKNRQEEVVRGSGADWVIVRPAQLTDRPAAGRYRVHTDLTGVRARTIARADVADFVVRQLTSDEYLRRTPLLTD